MTSIFDRWTDLDPALALRRIEAAHGSSVFDRYAYLDPQRALKQIEAALSITLDDVAGALSFRSLETAIDNAVSGGGYVAKAVNFPGGGSKLAQEPMSVLDSPNGTISFWTRVADISGFPILLNFGSASSNRFLKMQVGFNFNNDLGVDLGDGIDSNATIFGSDDGAFAINVWYWIFVSWRTDLAQNAKVLNLWINAVNVLNPVNTSDNEGSYSLPWTGATTCSFETGTPQDLLDYQMWTDQTIDPTPTNLAKFYNTGQPVNPSEAAAAFGRPAYLFSASGSNPNSYGVNQGTAGDVTLTGDLTFTDAPNA